MVASRRLSKSHRLVALAALLTLLAVACSSGHADDNVVASSPNVTSDPNGPCPHNLVIQTDWFPEVEHGGSYQLIGPGGVADKQSMTYRGELQAAYRGAHGVQTVEIRAGGAAIDNRSVSDVLYSDDSVYLGFVNTDDAVAGRGKKTPVVAVMATLDISPQMIMWSPARFTITKPTDLAKTRATVLYFRGSTYIDYLVAKGYVTTDQLDDTYKGDPSRWLASNGDLLQQGFATNEVYTYENLVEGWRKPVDFFLLHWMGYENYPGALSVRADQLQAKSACLKQLVPVMQRAWVDYLAKPAPVNAALVKVNDTYDTFFKISERLNERAVEMMRQFRLATNGSDDTFGNFDQPRVDRLAKIVSDVLKARGAPLPSAVTAKDVVTNDFVDPSIAIGRPTS